MGDAKKRGAEADEPGLYRKNQDRVLTTPKLHATMETGLGNRSFAGIMDLAELIRHSRPEEEDPRRRLILEAAGRLFYRYGFRKTSLDDIARECRISKKTIYQHFDGKDELVRAVLFELAYDKLDSVLWVFGGLVPEELKSLVEEPAAEPSLRDMLKVFTDFTRRMRQRFSMQMLTDLRTDYPELLEGTSVLREPFVRAVVEMLELGQKKGEVRAA
ncbi:MAG TPA: TetR/AcrR family transcriptional regulator, partial [Candidatus Coatesbacteria bacterium]|nr:TetR/AcrR family transcriptional regulator [Candidatus Coatesbacteria bacterium]